MTNQNERKRSATTLRALHRLYVAVASGHFRCREGSRGRDEMEAAMKEARHVIQELNFGRAEYLPAADAWQAQAQPVDGGLRLTPRQYDLYAVLAAHRDQIVPTEAITARAAIHSVTMLNQRIGELRAILAAAGNGEVIRNYRKIGYMLTRESEVANE